KFLTWFSVVGMFIVLMAGALVSKTGSGDGCGASWPLCHGELLPDGTIASLIEYNHRAVSGIVGIAVLVFSVVLWRNYGWRPEMRFFAGASVFFVLLQSGLRAWVVLAPQPAWLLGLRFAASSSAFARGGRAGSRAGLPACSPLRRAVLAFRRRAAGRRVAASAAPGRHGAAPAGFPETAALGLGPADRHLRCDFHGRVRAPHQQQPGLP